MVPSRSCIVSFTDSLGIEHSVHVSATSLFEAAALGIGEFRKSGFTEINIGPSTRLSVKIKMPETSHVVSVGKLVDWLKGSGKNPSEQILKNRLRTIVQC